MDLRVSLYQVVAHFEGAGVEAALSEGRAASDCLQENKMEGGTSCFAGQNRLYT